MQRSELNEKALKGASKNAQKAFDAVRDERYSAIPKKEKVVWAMSAIIHCDICRLVVAFEECEVDGLARLLWIADITSKLYEIRKWYDEKGGKLLLDISQNKTVGEDFIREEIRKIKLEYPIKEIEKYSSYRHKFGYHYDNDALDFLEKFGNEDAEKFHKMLTTFVRFSGEWAKLTKALIESKQCCK